MHHDTDREVLATRGSALGRVCGGGHISEAHTAGHTFIFVIIYANIPKLVEQHARLLVS